MEEKEKIQVKFRLAATLRKILRDNKNIGISNARKGIEDVSLIDGVRQLESSSRLSYTIVQGVTSGNRDLQFTTLLSLITDGLGLSFSEFANIYDQLIDEDLKIASAEITSSKRKSGNTAVKKNKKNSTN